MKNKSFITNFISLTILVVGYFSPFYSRELMTVGAFALSGALTNWLAVHMLFEKVPFLYGSGIVPKQFSHFKISIRDLFLTEFFNDKNLKKFFASKNIKEGIAKKIDFDKVFNGIVEAIENSQMGGMLAMVGGRDALLPLKEPIVKKLNNIIADFELSDSFDSKEFSTKITKIIDGRLDELTPEKVKIMVQKIIKNHLGWLVIWGGVFGGLIGLLVSFF